MPQDLVFVRHGESEGNIASRLAWSGDESVFTPEFVARHSSHWRLSDLGIEQAKSAGEWIRTEFPDGFKIKYSSVYERAQETAMYLGLDGPEWFLDINLRTKVCIKLFGADFCFTQVSIMPSREGIGESEGVTGLFYAVHVVH